MISGVRAVSFALGQMVDLWSEAPQEGQTGLVSQDSARWPVLEHLLQYLDTAGTGFVGLEASLGCERPWNLMPFVTAK